jgi:hypothetical protein
MERVLEMQCGEVLPSREDEALAALKASLLVRSIGVNSGAKKGVYARLWCARTEHLQRDSEQLNITKARTTIAQCAEELLELVNSKHACHMEAAQRECCRVAAEEAAAAGPSAPTTTFEAIAAAQHVQPAAEKACAAEQAASKVHEAKCAAEKALNEAVQAAAAAEVEAARLQAEADDARQAAGLQRKKARVEEADADPTPRSGVHSRGHCAREALGGGVCRVGTAVYSRLLSAPQVAQLEHVQVARA